MPYKYYIFDVSSYNLTFKFNFCSVTYHLKTIKFRSPTKTEFSCHSSLKFLFSGYLTAKSLPKYQRLPLF